MSIKKEQFVYSPIIEKQDEFSRLEKEDPQQTREIVGNLQEEAEKEKREYDRISKAIGKSLQGEMASLIEIRNKLGVEQKFGTDDALRFMQSGEEGIEMVALNMDKFENLDADVAKKIIEVGGLSVVLEYRNTFGDLPDEKIVALAYESGSESDIANNLDKLAGVDQVALERRLIKNKESSYIISNIDKFTDLSRDEIAHDLIRGNQSFDVINAMDTVFSTVDQGAIIDEILDSDNIRPFIIYIDRFSGFDQEKIAQKLFARGAAEDVVRHMDKFNQIDEQEIINKMSESNNVGMLADFADKFGPQGQHEIAERFIQSGKGYAIVYNIDKFSSQQQQFIVALLGETDEFSLMFEAADKLGLDQQHMISEMFRQGKAQELISSGIKVPESTKKILDVTREKIEIINTIHERDEQFQNDYIRDMAKEGLLDVIEKKWTSFRRECFPVLVQTFIDSGKVDFLLDRFEYFGEQLDQFKDNPALKDKFESYMLDDQISEERKTTLFASYSRLFAVSQRTGTSAALLGWNNLRALQSEKTQEEITKEDIGALLEKTKRDIAKKEETIKKSELDIPDGLGVSIGVELEIVYNAISRSGLVSKEEIIDLKKSLQKQSDPRIESFIKEFIDEIQPKIDAAKKKYVEDVQMATHLGVGKGRDAVHEFANRATDNYAVLLWEMQELGKLGFIDFDRKLIQWIEKGMHLTISGEGTGIKMDENANLLQRAMIATGWSANGLDAVGALEVVDAVGDESNKLYKQTKGFILGRDNLRDKVFREQNPELQKFGVENRALNMNSFEHLARTLRSFNRLAIPLKAYQENVGREIAMQLQAKVGDMLATEGSIASICENKELLEWLKNEGVETDRENVRKLILVWAAFRESTVNNFSQNQSYTGRYVLKSPLERFSSRDYTRLFGELDEVFDEARDDSGELRDDALLPYHQKAATGSLPDQERKIVISARSAVRKILGKK